MVGLDGSLLWQIIIGLILAGAVYGGIRSDIRSMHEHIRRVERVADQAHLRLDAFGQQRVTGCCLTDGG